MTGKFIVFEGVEGSGKTTQIASLDLWLQEMNQTVLTTRQPGGSELGRQLRQMLLEVETTEPIQDRTELFLYAADRAQHVENFLKPHLAAGVIVLCDRYTDSTIAYQGYGRGLDLDAIDRLNQLATGGLESDLTLWLDVDVEVGLARAKGRGPVDRIERASLEFHQRVRQGYTELAAKYPQRIVRIDAALGTNEVTQQIREAVELRCSLTSNLS